MLHTFLSTNHDELVERCRSRVARRSAPRPTPHEIQHGIPLFLGQLIETLRLDEDPRPLDEHDSGVARTGSETMARTATQHGGELLRRGFTVEQVVHDYGDLCQAVTELAAETRAPISAAEFHTFNLCLDNAIAGAVTEFGGQRARRISADGDAASSERLGSLAHELRNHLNTAILAFAAIKGGGVGINGATSEVVGRSFTALRDLIDGALAEVRLESGTPLRLVDVRVERLIAEVQSAASLEARERGCQFSVFPVEPELLIHADKLMLCSAISNLLQNAFKFTRAHSHVSLKAHGLGDRVLIEVEDECGGLPAGDIETMFHSFEQHGADRSGVGLGLSISRRAVEASGGTLRARDLPGIGCVFTIDMPRAAGLSVAARAAG